MEIKRPNHERTDLELEEHMAFWVLIIREYTGKYVRENSLLLYKNRMMVGNENAG